MTLFIIPSHVTIIFSLLKTKKKIIHTSFHLTTKRNHNYINITLLCKSLVLNFNDRMTDLWHNEFKHLRYVLSKVIKNEEISSLCWCWVRERSKTYRLISSSFDIWALEVWFTLLNATHVAKIGVGECKSHHTNSSEIISSITLVIDSVINPNTLFMCCNLKFYTFPLLNFISENI